MKKQEFVKDRVCTTKTLRVLAQHGKALGFNRQIEVPDDIDPDGAHLLSMRLFGHNADAATEFHHRVEFYLKRKDSMEPLVGLMDISDDDWNDLVPYSKVVETDDEPMA